jgi:tetratricopeptide (TPR) repeat protein
VLSLSSQISPEKIRQSADISHQAWEMKNARKIEQAALLYKKAMALNPYNYQALKELAHYELGKRNTIAAVKYFNEYLNIFPDEGEYYHCGRQFLNINDTENALAFFKQGYSLNKNPAFLHYIVSIYQRNGDTVSANDYIARLAKLTVQQKPSGKVILPASYSAVISNGGNPNARLEHISGDFSIGYWTNIEDSLRWQLNITRASRYKVEIIFACPQDQAGSRMELEVGGQKIRFTTNATQAWYDFKTVTIPGFLILNTGKQRVTLRGITKKSGAFINLRQIRLIPVGE